mmetsp:Transcript_98948/g.308598  ORF Transcript_98948/g.308598 Transcript_98948/m.308598 type:complete len:333 (+) Transcript_98948:152-1150(+)
MAFTIASTDWSPWHRYQSHSQGDWGIGSRPAEISSTRVGVPSPHPVSSSHGSTSPRGIRGHSFPRKTTMGQASLSCCGGDAPYASSISMSALITGRYIFFMSGLLRMTSVPPLSLRTCSKASSDVASVGPPSGPAPHLRHSQAGCSADATTRPSGVAPLFERSTAVSYAMMAPKEKPNSTVGKGGPAFLMASTTALAISPAAFAFGSFMRMLRPGYRTSQTCHVSGGLHSPSIFGHFVKLCAEPAPPRLPVQVKMTRRTLDLGGALPTEPIQGAASFSVLSVGAAARAAARRAGHSAGSAGAAGSSWGTSSSLPVSLRLTQPDAGPVPSTSL